MAEPIQVGGPDRRRLERRLTPTLAELTLPELRRMMVTTMLFVIILVLFLWMVRTVIIATILGIIVAMYMRPVYLWLRRYIPNGIVASMLTLTLRDEIAAKPDISIRRLPFMQEANTGQAVKRYVIAASNYGTDVLSGLR